MLRSGFSATLQHIFTSKIALFVQNTAIAHFQLPFLWFGLTWTSLTGSDRLKLGCRYFDAEIFSYFSAPLHIKNSSGRPEWCGELTFSCQFYDLGWPGRHYLAQIAYSPIMGFEVPRSRFWATFQLSFTSKMALDVQNEAVKPLSAANLMIRADLDVIIWLRMTKIGL